MCSENATNVDENKRLETTVQEIRVPAPTPVVLSLVLLTVFPAIGPIENMSESGYLARQTVALRPPFRHDLNAIPDMSFYDINASVDLQHAAR